MCGRFTPEEAERFRRLLNKVECARPLEAWSALRELMECMEVVEKRIAEEND